MDVSQSIAARLPEGYVARVPTLDDVEAVVALERACVTAGVSTGPSSAIDLRRHWDDPHRQDGDEDTLVFAPDASVVGYLEYYQYEPFTIFEFEVYVHPEHVTITRVLVELAEARARHGTRLAQDGERVVLHGHTVSTAHDLHRLLTEQGFAHIRNGLTMQIEMSEPPTQPEWAPGITVRRFVPGLDERAVWETTEAAWQDHWGYAPMPFEEFVYYRITAQTDFDPGLWLLAVEGETVAGALLGLHDPTGKMAKGRVSVLGVRREYRKRGLGLALLYEAFNEFWRRGYRMVNLGVDASSLTGADRLYERAGMREVGRTMTFEKVLRET